MDISSGLPNPLWPDTLHFSQAFSEKGDIPALAIKPKEGAPFLISCPRRKNSKSLFQILVLLMGLDPREEERPILLFRSYEKIELV